MLLDSLLGINFEFDHIKLGKISISLSTFDFLLKIFNVGGSKMGERERGRHRLPVTE